MATVFHTSDVCVVLYYWQLDADDRAVVDNEYDYMSDNERFDAEYVYWRDNWECITEFITTTPGPWNAGMPEWVRDWDGYRDDGYGIVLARYVGDGGESIDEYDPQWGGWVQFGLA